MPDLDAILARLDRLEAENAGLRDRLERLTEPGTAASPRSEERVSRRRLLRQAGGGVAAIGLGALAASVATVVQATPALAADGQPITVGGTFDATSPTSIHNTANANAVLVATSTSGGGIEGNSTSGTGVRGSSTSGIGVFGNGATKAGVLGQSISAAGVHGSSGTGEGVLGESLSGVGVHGTSTDADAILGETATGTGVHGQASDSGIGVQGSSVASYGVYGVSSTLIGVNAMSTYGIGAQGAGKDIGVAGASVSGPSAGQGTGVLGISGLSTFPNRATRTDIGVMGVSAHGRGGVFTGPAAPLQLLASTASTHPTTGKRGDLFVDKTGRLWFCKGATSWKLLA